MTSFVAEAKELFITFDTKRVGLLFVFENCDFYRYCFDKRHFFAVCLLWSETFAIVTNQPVYLLV